MRYKGISSLKLDQKREQTRDRESPCQIQSADQMIYSASYFLSLSLSLSLSLPPQLLLERESGMLHVLVKTNTALDRDCD